MNERIRELAKQAEMFAIEDQFNYHERFKEKFAELIVSDVLSEVGKFIRRNPGYWDEYGLVTDIAHIYAGVEE